MAHFFSESLSVIALSLVLNTIAERVILSVVVIFYSQNYKRVSERLNKVSLELSKKKDQIVSASEEKKHKKALQRLKEEESVLKRELSGMTTRINMIISIILMMMMGVFRSTYSGVVVAKLPFEPVSIFRSIFHSGLKKSTDPTDCCMTALYILCNMTFRQTIKILLGTRGPHSLNSFAQMIEEAEEKVDKYYKTD